MCSGSAVPDLTVSAAVRDRAKAEIARREKLKRDKIEAEADLLAFVRQFWHVLEPAKPLVEGWVLYAMINLLMAIADGHHRHVTINVPPGSMKSLLLAVFFPAWLWGPEDQPHLRFLSASYSSKLPERDNGRFLQLISSPEYQAMWGDRVKATRSGMELVENSKSGWKRAVSSNSGTTGHRGDYILCLPYEACIFTDEGQMRIGDIVNERRSVRIAGWDGNAVQWQEIKEYETNPSGNMVEVTFDGGCLRCTEDHRVWVAGRGYVAAGDIRPGNKIRSLCDVPVAGQEPRGKVLFEKVQGRIPDTGGDCREHAAVSGVRKAVLSPPGPPAKGAKVADVQHGLCRDHEYRRKQSGVAWWRCGRDLCGLRQDDNAQAQGSGTCQNLFQIMQGEVVLGRRAQPPQRRAMRGMRRGLQADKRQIQILLSAVFGRGAQSAYIGCQQSPVQRGKTGAQPGLGKCDQKTATAGLCRVRRFVQTAQSHAVALWWGLQRKISWREHRGCKQSPLHSRTGGVGLPTWLDADVPSIDPETGRTCLPPMWNDGSGAWESLVCPSYRLSERKPGPVEPDHALPVLSRADAREAGKPIGVDLKVVRFVKRVSSAQDVTYNLRVGPFHNYFADGVLVHNCDDMNDPNSVESDDVRTSTKRWLTEVMPSRLNDYETGVIINVQQRTHEEDATGTLREYWGDDFTWLVIPMEFDPLRATPVVLRWDDDGKPIEVWRDPRGVDKNGIELEGVFRDENSNLKIRMGSPMARAEGEWCWPERFPPAELASQKAQAYSWAGQYQQCPTVRGGGIIRNDWWQTWHDTVLPDLGTVVASLDTAIKEGEKNDYNAFTSWGAFEGRDRSPKLILTSAWRTRCSLAELVRRTAESCFERKVDYLLIEDKARGHDVAQEIATQYADAGWQTILIPANGRGAFSGDKRARLEAVSVMFSGDVRKVPLPGDPTQTMDLWSGGMIFAPYVDWAEEVIDEVTGFPGKAHDDYVDSVTMALSWIRRHGVVVRKAEYDRQEYERKLYKRPMGVPYAVI